ncbi:MAG: hypothetical protein ABI318_22575 [Chthoniobacteraceae bacterium]
MKHYRLLIAWQLWPQIEALPPGLRRALYRVFDQLEEMPDAVSEFQFSDQSGRLLDGFILGQLAFHYWIDFSDRHVKVVAIGPADRARRD